MLLGGGNFRRTGSRRETTSIVNNHCTLQIRFARRKFSRASDGLQTALESVTGGVRHLSGASHTIIAYILALSTIKRSMGMDMDTATGMWFSCV